MDKENGTDKENGPKIRQEKFPIETQEEWRHKIVEKIQFPDPWDPPPVKQPTPQPAQPTTSPLSEEGAGTEKSTTPQVEGQRSTENK
jgi:hypothetical protein